MLHITNGDAVIQGFVAGSIPGTHLPWRDVLHDGAVPDTPSLELLSDIRARVLANDDAGLYAGIRSSFADRDRKLAGFRSHEETVLWFEHDLYDQLQLVQLLDWFSRQDLTGTRLSLMQIGEHPEVAPFHGLGQLTGAQLARLLPTRVPVTAKQLDHGRLAWAAFRAPDPSALLAFTKRAEPEMPFLAPALVRFLEEYPSIDTGLSRTERQLLAIGASGARHRRDFYRESQALEACPWGDRSVYQRLNRLSIGDHPALHRMGVDEFVITDEGRRLVAEDADWIFLRPGIDVWLGGVHLVGRDAAWRWSATEQALHARTS